MILDKAINSFAKKLNNQVPLSDITEKRKVRMDDLATESLSGCLLGRLDG
jgi:hypothetical protein